MTRSIMLNGQEYPLPIEVIFNNEKKGKLHEPSTAWKPFKLIEVDGKMLYPSSRYGEWAIKEYLIPAAVNEPLLTER